MSIRNRGLFSIALEEEATGGEGVDSATIYGDGVAEAEVAARDAEEEVQRDSEAADRIFDTVDEGIDDTETLDAVGGSLGEAADKEVGITDVGIAPVIIATEALCRNLGLERVNILPSLESFGSKSSSVTATRMASVAIESVVSDAIATIKAMLVKAWEKLGKFMDGLVHLTETVVKVRIAKIRGAVKALPDDKDREEAKFKSPSVTRAFGLPSKRDVNPGCVKDVLKSHVGVGEAFTKLGAATTAFGSKVVEGAKSKKDSKEVDELYNAFMKDDFGHALSGAIGKDALVDGRRLDASGVKEDGTPDFKDEWAGKSVDEKDEVHAGTKAELNDILKEIDVVIRTIASIRKSHADMKKGIVEDAKKIEGLKDLDKGAKKAVDTAYSKYYCTLGITSSDLAKLQMLAVNKGLEYVGRSVAARKGTGKADEK